MIAEEAASYVVGFRSDEGGSDALNLAVSMAQAFDASLDLVSIVPGGRRVSRSDRGATRRARDGLERGAALVPSDIAVRIHVRPAGGPASGLAQAARDLGARLIVVGSDAHGGFGATLRRHTLGSVTTELLAITPVPVAVAPADYRVTRPIDSVDCAVGMRPGAQEVIDAALNVCVRSGLPLRVITLVDAHGDVDDAGVDEVRARVAVLMSTAVDRHGRPSESQVVFARGGDIPTVIAATKWLEASVLIVGSTRVDAPKRTILGATVSKIIEDLPIPLIVVPNRPGAAQFSHS